MAKLSTYTQVHINNNVDFLVTTIESTDTKVIRIAEQVHIFCTEKQLDQLRKSLEEFLYDETLEDVADKLVGAQNDCAHLRDEVQSLRDEINRLKFGEGL